MLFALKLSREGVKLPCEFEAAVSGWGALAIVVGEGLDTCPHMVSFFVVGLFGLFDAPQVGSGGSPQPVDGVTSSDQRVCQIVLGGGRVLLNRHA